MGDLVGMVGSQTSWSQALSCAEGAATDWQGQVTRWLAVEPCVGAGLVLPYWWRELGSEVCRCRASVPGSSVILLIMVEARS